MTTAPGSWIDTALPSHSFEKLLIDMRNTTSKTQITTLMMSIVHVPSIEGITRKIHEFKILFLLFNFNVFSWLGRSGLDPITIAFPGKVYAVKSFYDIVKWCQEVRSNFCEHHQFNQKRFLATLHLEWNGGGSQWKGRRSPLW